MNEDYKGSDYSPVITSSKRAWEEFAVIMLPVQNEESSKTDSPANDDSEPVFLERPIRKTEDEEDEGIFGEKTAGSPVKRKIKIAQTNIQINVGNGKSGPDDVSSNKPT